MVVPLFHELDSPPEGNGTIDSVAIWVAPNPAESVLFTTDKTDNVILMHNPSTKKFIGRLGSSGAGAGQLGYPNGVAVGYGISFNGARIDALFIVERDNHRVSIFSLPEQKFLGHFGAEDLTEPYGIALHWKGNQLQAWITETDSSPDRVYVYEILSQGESLVGKRAFFFDVAGGLESIAIDPANNRVLLCDESDARNVMVYDLAGNFVQRFGQGLFVIDPEGIALYDLGNGAGYIIITDQNASPTEFEVFDRKTLQWLGNFTGETRGTDGVALTQAALPNLPQGSFYAVHSDKSVHVYDWAAIAGAMNLSMAVKSPRTAVAERKPANPLQFNFLENYPNPFNPFTTISYRVDHFAPVHLDLYDSLGKHITRLVSKVQPAGEYQVRWESRSLNGKTVASGVYFARLLVGNAVYTHTLLLQK